VDLAGGTLDLWPVGLLHSGSRTINVAIDLPVEVRVEPSPDGRYRVTQGDAAVVADDWQHLREHAEGALAATVGEFLGAPPLHLELCSASPRGAGLGASSALTVCLLAAILEAMGRSRPATGVMAGWARDLEARLMGLPTGVQDHYPALLGGALEICHLPGGEEVRHLDVNLEELGACLLVVYTGQSHFSAGNNWEVLKRRLDGDREVVRAFDGIAAVATELGEALEAGDLAAAGRLMSEEWSWRRTLAQGISTPRIESVLDAAMSAGAWGGKACGAGGGGCVALLADPSVAERLRMACLGSAQVLPPVHLRRLALSLE
jgi:D-glycero-alpha-D-manno-heptose-7-phosphate kinase